MEIMAITTSLVLSGCLALLLAAATLRMFCFALGPHADVAQSSAQGGRRTETEDCAIWTGYRVARKKS